MAVFTVKIQYHIAKASAPCAMHSHNVKLSKMSFLFSWRLLKSCTTHLYYLANDGPDSKQGAKKMNCGMLCCLLLCYLILLCVLRYLIWSPSIEIPISRYSADSQSPEVRRLTGSYTNPTNQTPDPADRQALLCKTESLYSLIQQM